MSQNAMLYKNGSDLESEYEKLLHVSVSGKIRRPPNAFMLFARDHRKQVSQEHPNETNKSISTLLGQAWRSAPPEKKQKYYHLAKKLDLRHKHMYPMYSYNPKEARMLKKTRLRMKTEKTAVNESELKHSHCRPSASSASPYAEFLSETANGRDCMSNQKSNSSSSVEYMECTLNELEQNENSPKSVITEGYKPPDLVPERYPIVGAMDDPPLHHLPDTVQRMRTMAEALGNSKNNTEQRQTENVRASSDLAETVNEQYQHGQGEMVPRSHMFVTPWGPANSHPFYYGKRYAIPLEAQHDDNRNNGNHDHFHANTERQLTLHRQQPYLCGRVGQHIPSCSCDTCKFSSLYRHYIPQRHSYSQLCDEPSSSHHLMYPNSPYLFPPLLSSRTEPSVAPHEFPINFQLPANHQPGGIIPNPSLEFHGNSCMIDQRYIPYRYPSHGFQHQLLSSRPRFYDTVYDMTAELGHKRRMEYNQPLRDACTTRNESLASGAVLSESTEDPHFAHSSSERHPVICEPDLTSSEEVDVISDSVSNNSVCEPVCQVD